MATASTLKPTDPGYFDKGGPGYGVDPKSVSATTGSYSPTTSSGGNVTINGQVVSAANLPAGYGLTPEAQQRLAAGYDVSLSPGGGAQYFQTPAVNTQGANSVGAVGNFASPTGITAFNSNDPTSMAAAEAAGLPAPTAPSLAQSLAAATNASQYAGVAAPTGAMAGIAAPPTAPGNVSKATPAGGPAQGTFYTQSDGTVIDQYGNPVPGGIQGTSGWGTTFGINTGSADGGAAQAAVDAQNGISGISTPGSPSPSATAVNGSGSTLDTSNNPALAATVANASGITSPSTTQTDPNNPLTNQTLAVGAINDPLSMAESQYNTFANSSEPQYQADLRDALRSAAAGGAIGSGALNTSLGNITNTRQNTLANQQQTLLENALQQQNTNAYSNLSQADQQQAFQSGQQQTAYNQNLSATQEQSALNSTAFAQALSQLTAGMANNPAQMQATLSQIFGNDAAQANAALAGLTKASATNSTTAGSTTALQTALQQYINSLSGTGGTTGTGSTPVGSGQATYNPNDSTNDPNDPSTWTGGVSSNYGG